MTTENLSVSFNGRLAIRDINLGFRKNRVTSIIGPSGCGKSTLLRSFNFMHDLTPKALVTGKILFMGRNITEYSSVEVRKRIGMVFQKPNPFPTLSIFDNTIAGLKFTGMHRRNELAEIAEHALIQAGLWEEVKDRLKMSAFELSGGQQQRLCIARTLAVSPDVLLMDEPTSALDPISTSIIEETIFKLKQDYTVIVVTHNMQQAARISNFTAYMLLGDLIEFGKTRDIFINPKKKETEDYISGKFG
ncbi:MAG: phosphate ABC transporter ATP-binding protein [Ignavibacteria bacterium]|nr:phosphate ABC transporter ATP-binding protein [Ignavibacteria bacterium]